MLQQLESTEAEKLGTVSEVKKYSERKHYYPVKEVASKESVEVFQARVAE